MTAKIFPASGVKDVTDLVAREEKAYRDSILKAAEEILQRGARFLFLAGPSCSGKTTTGLELIEALKSHGKRVFSFSTDDFFFDTKDAPTGENGVPNFDVFEHTDSASIVGVLQGLCRGETVYIPNFDFCLGTRVGTGTPVSFQDYDVFILEGIHALNDVILEGLPEKEAKYCIYLDVTEGISLEGGNVVLSPTEIRFCRRLIRDFKHRNANAERTFTLWENVLSSEKDILHPFRKNADMTVDTNFCYEISVEKTEVMQILGALPEESRYHQTSKRLTAKLIPFPLLEETVVPKNSVLREFID